MKRQILKRMIIISAATLMISNLNYIPAYAKWINDSENNWNWVENGVKSTGWKEIDGKWYCFNEDGTMFTGWRNYNGNWYNLSSSGAMDTGWKKISGKWYNFDSTGKMSIGWINDNGTWYFTNSTGEMETGTLGIDGVVYNFSNNGQLLKNEKSNTETQGGLGAGSSAKNDDGSRTAYVSTNSDSLNVRADAVISSDIVGTVSKGEQVKITGDEKDGFYPLVINGKKGWVSSKWVSFTKPEGTQTTPITSTTQTAQNTQSTSSTQAVTTDSTSNADNSKTDTSAVSNNSKNLKNISLGAVRDTAPDLNSKYYYSDDNLFYKIKLSPPFTSGGKPIQGNCTWYTWGRAWELTGVKPDDAGFRYDAYTWWDANKTSGKYQYGSEPKIGAIAVWKSNLPNSGGCGHVAIVEKIENGKTYISESTWNGVTFRYREIYDTNYLYGYIYLDKPNH